MTPACERLRPAIEALAEGALDSGPLHDEAQAHADACAPCREAAEATLELREAAADVVPLPPPDVWRVFDGELRDRLKETAPERAGLLVRFGPRVLVAAAAVLVTTSLVFWTTHEPYTVLPIRAGGPLGAFASIPYGDPALPPAKDSIDPVAVEGLADVGSSLSPAARETLERRGVVQVPSGETRVADVYDHPRPLATADASLLLAGAVASQAALALEEEVIAPGLRDLLAHTLVELRALEAGTRHDDARRAARRARELLGVAAALAGLEPELPRESAERVRAELARLEAGRPFLSPLLGREVDPRALTPRGLFERTPRLHAHARAAAWLTLVDLPLDAARPDDVRTAAVIALALARGRGERRTVLARQAALEDALEVLHGPPDGVTPLDLIETLRQGLGTETLSATALAAPDAVAKIAARAPHEAAAHRRGRVRPPGAPSFRLIGGTQTLEGLVLARLAPPALARSAPTSLDLLVVLGSARARTVVSAERLDAPGYDEAVEDLAFTRAWSDPTRAVPVATCLEQARLWAAAALLGDDAMAAAGPVHAGTYRDRLLLAAFAGLNAPPPSAGTEVGARARADPDDGPLPLVEALPRLHARLAYTAERLARVVETLQPADAVHGPRAVAALRRVARLETALRDASLAALEGRPPSAATSEALRDYMPALRALGPARVGSAEDIYVQTAPGGVRVLHRVVHALDRLFVVVVDPLSGRPVLACGAALSATEVWTEGERLGGSDVPGARDPAWAGHVVRR